MITTNNSKINWSLEVETIQKYLESGETLHKIGERYNVSRQRMYQVLTKFGLKTPNKERKNYLRDKGPAVYWFSRTLCNKSVPKKERLEILKQITLPTHCPVFGYPLDYNGTGQYRSDKSPSLDRIDSSKGYTLDNIQILSWRANRIKNDSTPEELMKLAIYMSNLTKN